MAEVEATSPENSEIIGEPPAAKEASAASQESVPEPKRGRGRPAGAKDKAPFDLRSPRPEWSPFRSLNQRLRQPKQLLRQTQPLLWKAPQVQSPLSLARSSARLRRTF